MEFFFDIDNFFQKQLFFGLKVFFVNEPEGPFRHVSRA
jgi:hypothetical protein